MASVAQAIPYFEQQQSSVPQKVKEEIDACVEFAENSKFPDESAVYQYIYTQENYPFIKN